MFETELLILQNWTLKDFFIIFLMAGMVTFLLEYALWRVEKKWKFLARPIGLFLSSWILFSAASMLGAPKPAESFTSLESLSSPPIIGVSGPQSFAVRTGLRTGDRVLRLNSTEVNSWSEFISIMDALHKDQVHETDIEVQRGLEKSHFRYHLILTDEEPYAGILPGELFLREIFPSAIGSMAGLQVGDQIKAINGIPVRNLSEVKKVLLANSSKNVEMLIGREGDEMRLSYGPEATDRVSALGVRSSLLLNPVARVQAREKNPFSALVGNFLPAVRWSGWGLEKLALLLDLPKLNILQVSRHWFLRNPHDWSSAMEDFSHYLTLTAIFCASCIPFVIVGSYHVINSSRPRVAMGAQFVFNTGVLGALWVLVTASIDAFFVL